MAEALQQDHAECSYGEAVADHGLTGAKFVAYAGQPSAFEVLDVRLRQSPWSLPNERRVRGLPRRAQLVGVATKAASPGPFRATATLE
jgi:hypothetical protein